MFWVEADPQLDIAFDSDHDMIRKMSESYLETVAETVCRKSETI